MTSYNQPPLTQAAQTSYPPFFFPPPPPSSQQFGRNYNQKSQNDGYWESEYSTTRQVEYNR
jgi:hypothetical protein